MKTHTIDAQGKKIGRLASEAAKILMGKTSVDYAPNKVADVKVVVTNASKLDISVKKKGEKEYTRYSGHPGGLFTRTLGNMIEKNGYGEVVRIAVMGMLPKNKLQAKMIKNLTVTE
ncbi:MAG: 50S ribosomal protein L13 [Candidatus Paceibacterota bacterium]|jgi:large subunit ribosomal protein L13